MTDNYEFMRSSQPQSGDKYTPYVSKAWQHVPDINSGVYTNTSMSQVNFDLSSIFNSSKLVDTNDMFITLPVLINFACSATSATVPLTLANLCPSSLAQLKSGFHNLVHSADIQLNGKTVEQTQPFINKFVDFKLLSEMSQDDLRALGPSLGYSEEVDNPFSVQWCNISGATNGYSGNGVVNNRIYGRNIATGVNATGTRYQTQVSTTQYNNCVNTALSQRAGSYLNASLTTASATASNLAGGATQDFLMTSSALNQEFKPYYSTSAVGAVAEGLATIQDVAVIRLRDLFDSMANIGLCKRFDAVLRLYVNTGSIQITVANANATTCGYFASLSNSTFSNSCPVVVNHLPFLNTDGGLPNTATTIGVSVSLAKAPNLRVGSALITNTVNHFMPSCRCYYSTIELKPQLAIKYIEENRNKKVVYRAVISNQTAKIEPGSFSQLVQSGITHPTGLLVLPFVDNSLTNTGNFGPGGSPFDTNVCHPISLTDLQVQVGGVNVLSGSPLSYTFENFLEQVHLFESLTSSDLGISCGLISKQFFEVNRTYFVNLARSTSADNLTPRNIQVSFRNNSNVPINCLMFVVYLDELEIDVETGIVKK